jgi:hypothetical protein
MVRASAHRTRLNPNDLPGGGHIGHVGAWGSIDDRLQNALFFQ